MGAPESKSGGKDFEEWKARQTMEKRREEKKPPKARGLGMRVFEVLKQNPGIHMTTKEIQERVNDQADVHYTRQQINSAAWYLTNRAAGAVGVEHPRTNIYVYSPQPGSKAHVQVDVANRQVASITAITDKADEYVEALPPDQTFVDVVPDRLFECIGRTQDGRMILRDEKGLLWSARPVRLSDD